MFYIRLYDFEGSLDRLLALAERRELDIAAVALADVVGQCLDLIRGSASPDPDALGDFVAAAARLLYLKSLALLPRPPEPPAEAGEDDGAAEDLEALLREYRRFKAAAGALRGREEQSLRSFPRLAPPPVLPSGPGLDGVTLDRLVAIVQESLRRRPPDPPGEVPRETVTVRARLDELEALLAREGRVSFRAFIAASRSRLEVVVGFMAVLELIKRGQLAAVQSEPFGDIFMVAQVPVAVTDGGDATRW